MESTQKNYWLFRVSDKWGKRIDFCKTNNLLYCGWNFGLSCKSQNEILLEHPRASRMAIRFCHIQEGDIVIMPNYGGIAIGVVKSKQWREDLDWKDTLNVDWLSKWYPKKDLSSKFQTRLKFRGTFLNLLDMKTEIDFLIENEFVSLKETYLAKIENERNANKKNLATHLNKRADTYFQDVEFEKFILELFSLRYQGFEGFKNSQQQEAIDGKDLCLTYTIDELDLQVELNIQVKQHTGKASFKGVFQIAKSENIDANVISRNILVTSGHASESFKLKALEESVYVFGSEDIAEMILDYYHEISSNFLKKLNIAKTLMILE